MKHSALAAAVVLLAASCGTRRDSLPGFPRLVLWAWDRPEHLDFVDPRAAGVAFLARTISWHDGRVESRPRNQPLSVGDDVRMMAVVRLQGTGPLPDAARVADVLQGDAAHPGIAALEIDFDARRSERAWYRGLLERLRAGLPPYLPLTMTALASWCTGDPWIRGLPVVDAVPMLFRMGAGEPRTLRTFRTGICQSSLGVSTDELPDKLPSGKRLFMFNPHAWTESEYRAALVWARRWQ
jgi:hypothetical protein